jgi:hypothetical protein
VVGDVFLGVCGLSDAPLGETSAILLGSYGPANFTGVRLIDGALATVGWPTFAVRIRRHSALLERSNP